MSENFTEILLIKMKSPRDEGIGRERKIGSQIPHPLPLSKSSLFSGIFHCLQSSPVSDCGISTSGEGRDFSEIIAVFLQRNIFEKQKGLCYGGKLGKGGGWQGCRAGAEHFPLPALICQLSCRQDEAGGPSWLPGVMRGFAAFLFQRHAEHCWD